MTTIERVAQEQSPSDMSDVASKVEEGLSTIGAQIYGAFDLNEINKKRTGEFSPPLTDEVERVFSFPALVALSSIKFGPDGHPESDSKSRYDEVVRELTPRAEDTFHTLFMRALFQALKSEADRYTSRTDPVKGREHIFGLPIDRKTGDEIYKHAKATEGSIPVVPELSLNEMIRGMSDLMKTNELIVQSKPSMESPVGATALLGSAETSNENNSW